MLFRSRLTRRSSTALLPSRSSSRRRSSRFATSALSGGREVRPFLSLSATRELTLVPLPDYHTTKLVLLVFLACISDSVSSPSHLFSPVLIRACSSLLQASPHHRRRRGLDAQSLDNDLSGGGHYARHWFVLSEQDGTPNHFYAAPKQD